MYLSDKDIKSRLSEMNITCENKEHLFNIEEQVQPASIDLRLSNIFWEPLKKMGSIDLRKRQLLDIDPRRYWKKRVIYKGEYITLNPGKLLLCRTYEKFSIPKDCSGKIEGRSSFSRMGLGIHCTGDFVNPGYRGHMPLELFNYGPNPIKIFPYLPICQLILIQLSSRPSRFYGEEELQSKYMDDDGGPSFWWRDKRIKKLHEVFRNTNISIDMEERILGILASEEPKILERCEKMIEEKNIPEKFLGNADMLLEYFKTKEKKMKIKYDIIRTISLWLFPTLIGVLLGSLLIEKECNVRHFILFIMTILSSTICYKYYNEQPEKFYVD